MAINNIFKAAAVAIVMGFGVVNANATEVAVAEVAEATEVVGDTTNTPKLSLYYRSEAQKRVKDRSAQSDLYVETADPNGNSFETSYRNQTGMYIEADALVGYRFGNPTYGGGAALGYRGSFIDIAGYGKVGVGERNDHDLYAGQHYTSYEIGARVVKPVWQDKAGNYRGDANVSLLAEAGATTTKHNSDAGNFLQEDGTVDNIEMYHNGWSFKAAVGAQWQFRLSKKYATFLNVRGLATYSNDPYLNGQISKKFGAELNVGFVYVFGKTHRVMGSKPVQLTNSQLDMLNSMQR